MDKTTTPTAPVTLSNGLFVRGVVVSNRAKAIRRKDGSGIIVIVEHEIALQPGVVTWPRFFDPKTDTTVRVDGENVLEFPKLKEFAQVTIRAGSIRSNEKTKELTIQNGELLG
jgi:hypothetical protein